MGKICPLGVPVTDGNGLERVCGGGLGDPIEVPNHVARSALARAWGYHRIGRGCGVGTEWKEVPRTRARPLPRAPGVPVPAARPGNSAHPGR